MGGGIIIAGCGLSIILCIATKWYAEGKKSPGGERAGCWGAKGVAFCVVDNYGIYDFLSKESKESGVFIVGEGNSAAMQNIQENLIVDVLQMLFEGTIA